MPQERKLRLILFLLIVGIAVTIGMRLVVADSGRLAAVGHLGDNVAFPLPDGMLYQAFIICLAALMAPFLLGSFRKAKQYLLAPRPITFLAVLFLFVLVTTNAISYWVLEHFPRDVDNIARLFQAQTFADGKLYVESPPDPEAFRVANVVVADGKMYSKYAPGSALVYALWQRLLGIQWGVNPFLGACMLLVLYGVLKAWYSELEVRLSLVFMCLSPFFLFMTSGYHSHLPCLFFLMASLLFLGWGHQHEKWYHFLASGLCLGLAVITRPYTAILVSTPFLIGYLLKLRSTRALAQWLVLALGFVLPLAFLLYYNDALTGHPLRFPFLVADAQERIGFGHKGHTPLKGLSNTAQMLELLNLKILGWPCGLLFVVLFVLLGKKHRWDRLAFGSVACLVVGHSFYYWIDFSFGPRFYFEMLPFMVLLSVRGIVSLPSIVERLTSQRVSSAWTTGLACWLAFLSFLFSGFFYIPGLVRMYHRDYNHIIHTRVASVAEKQELTDALVLMRQIPGHNAYASGFLENELDFRGNIVYARDLPNNQPVLAAYPNRQLFLFTFDRNTRQGTLIPYPRPSD